MKNIIPLATAIVVAIFGGVVTACAEEPGTGLTAFYGNSMDPADTPVLSRIDAQVDFDWGNGSPATSINNDQFSVRWLGQIKAVYTEEYTFYVRADDGVRLWVDGELLVDAWWDQAPTEYSGTISLVAGELYDIRLEYFEHGGGALAELSWSSASTSKEIVPQAQLYPSGNSMVLGQGQGLLGRYVNSMNPNDVSELTRTDSRVDFNWGYGSPDASIGADHFSVRWIGQVQAQFSETYTFYVTADDGVRLWVNGVLLIDAWWDQGATEYSHAMSLVGGEKYDIRLEYYENSGNASAELNWSSDSTPKQLIPKSQLYPSGNSMIIGTGQGLAAKYFANDLDGVELLSRTDPVIAFDWGYGSPDNLVPNDNFAVRWTGQVQAQFSEPYTFYVRADDGVRLWVDRQLIIDQWHDQGATEYNATVSMIAGQRYDIAIEYYEHGGEAVCQLSWASPSTFKDTIPQTQLYPNGYGRVIGDGTGLMARYVPSLNPDDTALITAVDSIINFDWSDGTPDPLLNPDHFSVRWLGQVQAQLSESYTFHTFADDGVRLWVNGQLLIDSWSDQWPTEHTGEIALVAGEKYGIRMEYYENTGGAVAKLYWSSYSTPKELIPTTQLYPFGNSMVIGQGEGLLATYVSSMNPDDIQTKSRIDHRIDFDWAYGSPDVDIPNDHFSARWIGQVQAQFTETYTFYVRADDGVRLWLNHQVVVDSWHDQGATEYSASLAMTAGEMCDIEIEYYENAGSAVCELRWSSASTLKQFVPQSQLYPSGNSLVIGDGDGLRGLYLDNSLQPTGDFDVLRVDATVDFDWSYGSPAAGVGDDHFAVRWTGQVQAQVTENYRFFVRADDGVRLWINRRLLIDEFKDEPATEYESVDVPLVAGQKYDIVLDYYENTGQAVCQLKWSSPSTPKRIVPRSQLYSSGNTMWGAGNAIGLLAQYFNSADLSSQVSPFNVPTLSRVDPNVNFDWANESPDVSLNNDLFSARWIGEVQAEYDETYTFYVTADDGVRLWVGNKLLINAWVDQPPTTYTASIDMKAGQKMGIKMEYYERYGGAVAKLEWSSASTPRVPVPESQLSNDRGISVQVPQYSVISPAFIEGIAWSSNGADVSVSVNGVAATFIGENNWFANVSLNANGSQTSVISTQSGSGKIQTDTITWIALDLSGEEASDHSIAIRRGDSLLLTASGDGETLTLDVDSDGQNDFSGVPGQKFAVTYNDSGTFLATAKIDGESVGTLLVNVMDVDLHKPIADEVGYRRRKNVVISPAAVATNVVFTSGDLPALETSLIGPFSNEDGEGLSVYLTALKRGSPVLVARLFSADGPIVAYKNVDEYTLDRDGIAHAFVNEDENIGGTKLIMRPYIPNIRFQFDMFAHTATFAGGVTSFSRNTSDVVEGGQPLFTQEYDPDTNETVGVLTLELEVPPEEENYCFTTNVFQSSSAEMTIASEGTATNGCVCKGKVDDLILCVGDTGNLAVTVKHEGNNGCNGIFPITINPAHASFTAKKDNLPKADCGNSKVTGSTEVKGNDSGYCDVKIGGATFKNAITVIQLTLTVREKLLATGSITPVATATPDISGTWSWSHTLGGTFDPANSSSPKYTAPAAITDATKKDTVTATYTASGHSCSITKTLNITAPRKFSTPKEGRVWDFTTPVLSSNVDATTPTKQEAPVWVIDTTVDYKIFDQFGSPITDSAYGGKHPQIRENLPQGWGGVAGCVQDAQNFEVAHDWKDYDNSFTDKLHFFVFRSRLREADGDHLATGIGEGTEVLTIKPHAWESSVSGALAVTWTDNTDITKITKYKRGNNHDTYKLTTTYDVKIIDQYKK